MLVMSFHDVIETPGGTRRTRWSCRCDCGVEKVVRGQDLVNGLIKSCGCFRDESTKARFTTHGHGGSVNKSQPQSREYRAWAGAKKRCTNQKESHWKDYGGRGILMCDRWLNSFEAFLADMGTCPNGFEIDRIDVDGNYEPNNCRWISHRDQAVNKRNTCHVEMHDGSRRPLIDVCREMAADYFVVHGRLRSGWTLGEAIAIPVGMKRGGQISA